MKSHFVYIYHHLNNILVSYALNSDEILHPSVSKINEVNHEMGYSVENFHPRVLIAPWELLREAAVKILSSSS